MLRDIVLRHKLGMHRSHLEMIEKICLQHSDII